MIAEDLPDTPGRETISDLPWVFPPSGMSLRNSGEEREVKADADDWLEFERQTGHHRQQLSNALHNVSADGQRVQLAVQLDDLARQTWESEMAAADKRTSSGTLSRVATWATTLAATVAAGSGGALIAKAGGAVAYILGSAAILAGVLGPAAGLWARDYERNREKRRLYEQLWWDIWTYTLAYADSAPAADIALKLNEFTRRKQLVG